MEERRGERQEIVVLDEGLEIEGQVSPMACCFGSYAPYRTE